MVKNNKSSKSSLFSLFSLLLIISLITTPVFGSAEDIQSLRQDAQPWEAGINAELGENYKYDGVVYEVIQAHTTLTGWEPPNVPALFVEKTFFEIGEATKWEQPINRETAYPEDAVVLYEDSFYQSLLNENTYEPPTNNYQFWELVENPKPDLVVDGQKYFNDKSSIKKPSTADLQNASVLLDEKRVRVENYTNPNNDTFTVTMYTGDTDVEYNIQNEDTGEVIIPSIRSKNGYITYETNGFSGQIAGIPDKTITAQSSQTTIDVTNVNVYTSGTEGEDYEMEETRVEIRYLASSTIIGEIVPPASSFHSTYGDTYTDSSSNVDFSMTNNGQLVISVPPNAEDELYQITMITSDGFSTIDQDDFQVSIESQASQQDPPTQISSFQNTYFLDGGNSLDINIDDFFQDYETVTITTPQNSITGSKTSSSGVLDSFSNNDYYMDLYKFSSGDIEFYFDSANVDYTGTVDVEVSNSVGSITRSFDIDVAQVTSYDNPTVNVLNPSNIGETTVDLNIDLESLGTSTNVDINLKYKETTDTTYTTETVSTQTSTTGVKTESLTGLSSNTGYDYFFEVVHNEGTLTTTERSFTTQDTTTTPPPTGLDLTSLNNAVISYYNFDENTGTTAGDSKGSNDLDISGATWINGKVGSALSFDGNNDYLTQTSNTDFTGGTAQTYTFWIKTTSTSGQTMIMNENSGHTQRIYLNDGEIQSLFSSGGSSNGHSSITTNANLNDGNWNHVVIIIDDTGTNSEAKYYKNGVELTQTINSDTSIGNLNTGSIYFMADQAQNRRYLEADLDELAIFNHALTSDERTFLYNNGNPGSDEQYQFTEQTTAQPPSFQSSPYLNSPDQTSQTISLEGLYTGEADTLTINDGSTDIITATQTNGLQNYTGTGYILEVQYDTTDEEYLITSQNTDNRGDTETLDITLTNSQGSDTSTLTIDFQQSQTPITSDPQFTSSIVAIADLIYNLNLDSVTNGKYETVDLTIGTETVTVVKGTPSTQTITNDDLTATLEATNTRVLLTIDNTGLVDKTVSATLDITNNDGSDTQSFDIDLSTNQQDPTDPTNTTEPKEETGIFTNLINTFLNTLPPSEEIDTTTKTLYVLLTMLIITLILGFGMGITQATTYIILISNLMIFTFFIVIGYISAWIVALLVITTVGFLSLPFIRNNGGA